MSDPSPLETEDDCDTLLPTTEDLDMLPDDWSDPLPTNEEFEPEI